MLIVIVKVEIRALILIEISQLRGQESGIYNLPLHSGARWRVWREGSACLDRETESGVSGCPRTG